MPITVKIAGVDRTEYVDARSLSIIDEITGRACVATFDFICKDIAVEPVDGETVLIEEGATKLFSGRILSKEGGFLPPYQLKYTVECVDHTRDLDKKLVVKSFLNEKGGDIIKYIVDNYTAGFTYVNVQDGPTLTKIAFDHIQASEAITQVAEACGYQWYIDYDKDLYFFLKTDYPASFQLDDDQKYYKDLIINTDISQLRNRVYVKSSKYETLDFTEIFIGDGATVTWTCKYTPNALPAPSLKLDGVAKTVGWFGVDDPALFDFMLNAGTGVLSLGTGEPTPGVGEEIVPTYGADVPIIIMWDDEVSIAAVAAIEGGDGIHEFCITDNNVDTKEWAIDLAKADLLENADPVIQGTFLTDDKTIRSGQIITLDSVKRGITQDFLVQKVELLRVDVNFEYPRITYKPATEAIIGYKPAADGEIAYRSVAGGWIVYYIYEVTIATKIKGLEDLLLQLLYQGGESLKRDTDPPGVPTSLALTTGMGVKTQAGLTWLRAAWDANTEDDFDHYELKYKKTAFADFGYTTTVNTTYLWESLEQNIEYQVYIRAVDIYGNRSAWSGVQTQTTANDTDAPTQVADQVATALLAGIKIEWSLNADTNIAYYKVERQESDDGTTWIAAWGEVARVTVDIWLDLLLTYTKFYRYRITAYNQNGVAGVTSGVTADSIAADKTGTNDLVLNCVTADIIAANSIYTNALQAGCVEAGKINVDYLSAINANLGTITAGTFQLSNTGYIRTVNKTSYADTTAGFWLGYEGGAYKFALGTGTNYLKWSGTSLYLTAASIRGRLTVGGGTNEDIYFEDSAIRMYDYNATLGDAIILTHAGRVSLFFNLVATACVVGAVGGSRTEYYADDKMILNCVSNAFYFYAAGTFTLPSVEAQPTGHNGDLAYHPDGGADPRFHGYLGAPHNQWGNWQLNAGW